ncbi:MAG TPA: phenylacetate--CoA ligase family protein, partial [Acidobacteriota bacterium]|nr:phenylacetate--CoA ligase family protein [Acidobacteriota bacterium]
MTLQKGRGTREEIERHQLARLRELLSELAGANRFYSARLHAAGIDGALKSLDDFRRAMPFTLKRELVEDQRLHPPYGTNLTYSLDRYTRLCQTSATSGSPLRWLDTPQGWNWMLQCWLRIFAACGVTARDRIFFAFSFAPFLGFWTAFEAAVQMGCLCIPGGGMGSAARLRMIYENQATVLCCTPTYSLRLAEVAESEGVDLRDFAVSKIIVAGEPGGSIPAVRARIETVWPAARVFDHHGLTEIGPVSFPCSQVRDRLHILESEHLPEAIDPRSGQPAGAGAEGELVLTNLGRPGSPLLRYRTGDLIKVLPSQTCACGSREMALQGGVLARTDDMVIVRGVNVYPSAVEEVVRRERQIVEFRAEVDV